MPEETDPTENDLKKCFEAGALIQARLGFALHTLTVIQTRAKNPPEELMRSGAFSYKEYNNQLLEIERGTIDAYVKDAIKVLETSHCGVDRKVIAEVKNSADRVMSILNKYAYVDAHTELNRLMGKLLYPDLYFK